MNGQVTAVVGSRCHVLGRLPNRTTRNGSPMDTIPMEDSRLALLAAVSRRAVWPALAALVFLATGCISGPTIPRGGVDCPACSADTSPPTQAPASSPPAAAPRTLPQAVC